MTVPHHPKSFPNSWHHWHWIQPSKPSHAPRYPLHSLLFMLLCCCVLRWLKVRFDQRQRLTPTLTCASGVRA